MGRWDPLPPIQIIAELKARESERHHRGWCENCTPLRRHYPPHTCQRVPQGEGDLPLWRGIALTTLSLLFPVGAEPAQTEVTRTPNPPPHTEKGEGQTVNASWQCRGASAATRASAP